MFFSWLKWHCVFPLFVLRAASLKALHPRQTNGWIPKMMGLGKGELLSKRWPFWVVYVRFLVV